MLHLNTLVTIFYNLQLLTVYLTYNIDLMNKNIDIKNLVIKIK